MKNGKTPIKTKLQHGMSKLEHPFQPIYNSESKILLLGSFPSVTSREKEFYFSHPQNDFWKILEILFDEKVGSDNTSKKEFLLRHKIALWDVVKSCNIVASSDASIKNVKVNNIKQLIKKTKIKKIYTIGKTAEKLYKKFLEKHLEKEAILLPSTSPAYRRITFNEKLEKFKIIMSSLK